MFKHWRGEKLIKVFLALMIVIGAMFVFNLDTECKAESGTYRGVDWDLTDGVLTIGKDDQTQTFSNATSQNYSGWPWYNNRSSITSARFAGNVVGQGSMNYMFYQCSKLASLDISGLNTSSVTNMEGMFNGCSKLISLDVSNFNTSNVTNMHSMFSDCSEIISLDMSHFDTSIVTNMDGMFNDCSGLTSLDVSGFNTSNVTSMGSMFNGCSELTFLDVSGFNTSNVTNMRAMFEFCSKLTSLDLSNFNTTNVTDMGSMFYHCPKLISLDLSNFDTSRVTNMSWMFWCCSNLTSLNISGFNTSKVTDMNNMFSSCSGLTALDVSEFNTSKVTDMNNMFSSCSGLTSLDVSGFDTSNVTSMRDMFSGCSGLTSLDASSFDTLKVTNMYCMFHGCSGLTALDVSGFNTSKVTNMGLMFYNCSGLTSFDLSSWDTSKVTDMNNMFVLCSKLTSLDLSNFDTSNVTSMNSMFNGCSGLTSLDVSNFNTSNVTDIRAMFYNCSKLIEVKLGQNFSFAGNGSISGDNEAILPVGKWKNTRTGITYNETELRDSYIGSTMYGTYVAHLVSCARLYRNGDLVFYDNSRTTEFSRGTVDNTYTGWDTVTYSSYSSVPWYNKRSNIKRVIVKDTVSPVSTAYWFYYCTNMTNADLEKLDTSNVTDMRYMFNYCSKLKKVKLGSEFSFKGNGIVHTSNMAVLPTPTGNEYSGKWIKEDGTDDSYTPEELRNLYNGFTMSGTYIWEEAIMNLVFEKPVVDRDQYLGSMPNQTLKPFVNITLPVNRFTRLGYVFDHWIDENGNEYEDRGVIPANRYSNGDTVTLIAVFMPFNGSVVSEDGQFEFNLQSGTTTEFGGIPGNTQYQIWEETPSGWQLIQEGNTSGKVPSNDTSVVAFRNNYDPTKVEYKIVARKWMENSEGKRYLPESGEYTFELMNKNGDLLQSKTNNELGVISFDPITYLSIGTYEYSIKEVAGDDSNIMYDDSVIPIKVDVVDDGAGHLAIANVITKYSHTTNIDDTGKKVSNYDNSWGNNNIVGSDRAIGDSNAHVVTIPSAKKLTVDIYYNGESANYDWVCIWEGNHPEYTAQSNYSSSLSGKLGGSQSGSYTVNGNSLTSMGHQTYTIDSDTVTFSFRSDSSGYGQGYGYYAVVTGNASAYGDDIVFVNKVNTLGSLRLTKIANDETGNTSWNEGETFSFNITFRDKYDSVPSDACNTYLSDEASAKGWTYDNATGVMTVVLNENKQSAVIENIPYGLRYSIQENLSDSSLYELTGSTGNTGVISETQSEAVFTNTFKTVPTSVMLMAYKTADFDFENGQFEFELLNADKSEVLQRVSNGDIIEDGMYAGKAPIVFDSIPITEAKDYVYYIREKVDSGDIYDYDDQLIKVTVHVVNDHGYLKTNVSYEKQLAD